MRESVAIDDAKELLIVVVEFMLANARGSKFASGWRKVGKRHAFVSRMGGGIFPEGSCATRLMMTSKCLPCFFEYESFESYTYNDRINCAILCFYELLGLNSTPKLLIVA